MARAARYQLPLTLAIIGGNPLRFNPWSSTTANPQSAGAKQLPIAVHSPGYVADTDEMAREEFFPT